MSTERSYHFTHLLQVSKKSLYPFVASFKEISLKSDFIQFFHDLIHVYNPGAGGGGAGTGGGQILMSTETSCHFGHLLLISYHRRQ